MSTSPEQEERSGQSLLAAVSNSMVQALKEYYGKGPTKAKAYMVDEYLFVAMREPFTVAENTLIRSGKHHLVREYRQAFENEMARELMSRIEDLTGRRVLSYQSQILFDPDILFEVFVLDPAGDGSEESRATAEEQGLMREASPEIGEAQPSEAE